MTPCSRCHRPVREPLKVNEGRYLGPRCAVIEGYGRGSSLRRGHAKKSISVRCEQLDLFKQLETT